MTRSAEWQLSPSHQRMLVAYTKGMWPFSALRRARYRRRYEAAWIPLLGRYTHTKLTPEQQAAVRERDVAYLTAIGVATARIINRMPQRFFVEYVFAIDVPIIDPILLDDVHHTTRDGRRVTWRDWMRNT